MSDTEFHIMVMAALGLGKKIENIELSDTWKDAF